jgi:hypothetical protein
MKIFPSVTRRCHRWLPSLLDEICLDEVAFTGDILLFFSPESAQLRFALKNFGRISSDLGEFHPFCSRRICCFGEISPKSKEIRPKFWGRNLTARIRPFRARKIFTVLKARKLKFWQPESFVST